MAKPNNIYKHSARKMILCVEEVKNTEIEANECKEQLNLKCLYHTVRITRFKSGARPNKYNGFKQHYQYAIRAYSK